MKSYIINKYPNYNHGAAGINFSHYFDGSRDWLYKPEPLLDYLKKEISSNIHTIINFGCASGRDFIPFQETYTCVGFDLAPIEKINWVCKTDNLIYFECSIEDFILNIDEFTFIDWENTLLYSCVSLMYATSKDQNKLIDLFLEKGCKNIVLQEYEPGNSGPNPYLDLNEKNLKLFEKKLFRENHHHNPMAHLYLNK